MTISTTSNTAIVQGNGLTTSFDFSFPVPLASELFVYYTAAGLSPVLLNSSQYSTTGIGTDDGGSITYPLSGSPIPSGASLTIQRVVPYQQLTSLVNQSGYYPNVVENALDYLTMQTQQLAQAQQLSLQVPLEATSANLTFPIASARAGTLAGFDVNGNAITYPITSSVGAGEMTSEGPFVAGTNFTPGTTTSLTLSQSYGSPANVEVHFDGTYQGTDQYSLNGDVITFTSPIPAGTNKVYIVGGTTLSIYAPAAGSVTSASFAPGAVNAAAIATGAVSAKLATEAINQLSTGQFFTSNGARISRFNDRVFLGTATQFDGNNTPLTYDWTGTTFEISGVGAYRYLPVGASFAVGSPVGDIAGTFYTRASDGTGNGSQAAIGVASLAVNDNSVGGGAATWCFYGTTVRTASSTGTNTNGVEIDVANLGATVPIYPNNMFPIGQTGGIGICAGGELGSDPSVTLGTSSYALSIAQNDPSGHASWDKGIVFASTAIHGANGASGTGIAIAFASGHTMQWYNNSNQTTNQIVSTTVNSSNSNTQNLQFSDSGTLFVDAIDNVQFRVLNGVVNAANYLAVTAAPSGVPVQLSALGNDVSVDLQLVAKGAGQIWVGPYTAGAPSATGYISVKDASGTARRLLCA